MAGFTEEEIKLMTPEERKIARDLDAREAELTRPSMLSEAGGLLKKTGKLALEVGSGVVDVLNPWGRTIDPAAKVRAGGPQAKDENSLTGFVKGAAEMATPENVGGIGGAEVGRRVGGDIGEKVGGMVPGGPLTKAVGAKTGRYIGSVAGRLTGAYAGGVAARGGTDILFGFTPTTDEELDNWYRDLHEGGRKQVVGEAVGTALEPVGAAARAGYQRLQKLGKGNSTLDVKAIAAWAHDRFKTAVHGMEADSAQGMLDKARQQRFKETINPEEAQKAVELSGMTIPEKSDSRVLDIFQGVSAGSMMGGGVIRRLDETRNQLAGLTALQIGMDVGETLDPADLYTAVQSQVGEQFEKALTKGGKALNVDEYVGNVMGNAMLQQANPNQMVKVLLGKKRVGEVKPMAKKFVGPPLPPKEGISLENRFSWVNDLNGQHISVEDYKQYRDQLMSIQRNTKVSDEYKGEAKRLLGLLDRGIERQLTPGSRDILRTIQKVEAGKYNNDMRANLVKGLLLAKGSPRKFIDGITSKPDYKKLTFLIDLVPDEGVKNSLRREVVNKLLGTSLVPGGDLTSSQLSKNLEINFGRKTMEQITSKDTVNNIDKLIQYRQHLEQYKARGEPGRVMVALTQGSQIAGLVTSLGSGALLSGVFGESDYDKYGGPGIVGGMALMFGPKYMAKALTSPYANQYVRFAKLASSGRASPGRVRAAMHSLLQASGDTQLAEHLVGRAANVRWGEEKGDREAEQYMRDNYTPDESYNTPDKSYQRRTGRASPGNIYPEGVELGR